jgi:hypothetical protein
VPVGSNAAEVEKEEGGGVSRSADERGGEGVVRVAVARVMGRVVVGVCVRGGEGML